MKHFSVYFTVLRLGSFKRQTNATTSIYIIYVQCRYLMLQIGGVFFPEISLCCFPPPLTSSLCGCHFYTIVFLWFCSNDHKIGLSVLYTCFHLQVWKSCQILSRPRLGLYILYLLDPDCNYRVIPQLWTNYGIVKHVLSGIRLIDGSSFLVGSTQSTIIMRPVSVTRDK